LSSNTGSMMNQDHEKQASEMSSSPAENPERVGLGKMLVRLVVGSVIIGGEELKSRFQESQSQTHIPPVILEEGAPIETDSDRARYAVLGALASSTAAAGRNMSTLGRLSNRAFRGLKRAARPVTENRIMSPFHNQYRRFTERGEDVLSGWIAAGRREEYLSRQLVRDTTTEAIEETLDYLAESPEMDELIQQQSGDLIEDIFEDTFDDIGGQTSRARLIMVGWFNRTILRRSGNMPVTSDQNPPPDSK
jgi:hypothetical protein